MDFPRTLSELLNIEQSDKHPKYTHLTTVRDLQFHVDWYLMGAEPRPCFTPELLQSLLAHQQWLVSNPQHSDINFTVCASMNEGVFNLGGDLDKFSRLIKEGNQDDLRRYGRQCVEALINHTWHLNNPRNISINLIQGDALGGGFECALSATTIIAEKGVKMGFPESLFNLFPGMGAFSYLSRRIPVYEAKRMILDGHVMLSDELYEMGVIDILAEKGEGIATVYDYMAKVNRNPNSHLAMQHVMCEDPRFLGRDELLSIVDFWAESALNLRDKDLRMMERLVTRQTKLYASLCAA